MILKRIFDIIVAFIGLLLLWPLILIIALVVRFTSKGPVLFVQSWVGKEGKLFSCYKFRTMVRNAEKEGSITVATDLRITAVGKTLRKYKLDELPQLWNVLIGKMSFVGPRPDVPGYADTLKGDDAVVLSLRPGITGPATLYFRNEEELLTKVDNPRQFNDAIIWPLKVAINKKYFQTWNFFRDIGYILITIIPRVNKILKLVNEPPHEPSQYIRALDKFRDV
ncbi:MAG TPA: sugar transferase [Chitinispirillaceae bacterium]|nr:sugar transferase [Chitinispirillaceae bacterium]